MESLSEPGYVTTALLRWRGLTDLPLMILAIGSLPVLLLEFNRNALQHSDQVFIDIVNLTVLVAFAVDYLVELSVAGRRGLYARREWTSLLIVVTQALTLFPVLAPLGTLRALRAARLFRILAVVARAAAVTGSATQGGRALIRRHAASLALGVAGLTWLTAAAAFTVAEGGDHHSQSFADGLWWAAATITTVGYGDVYPVTPVGRLIGGFTMVVGISTFALVTAKIAQFLMRTD